MPDPVYLAIKVPFNFLRNFFGVTFASNTDPNLKHPWFIWRLPPSIHFGSITWIEFAIEPKQPAELVVRLATVFAFAPWVMSRWRKRLAAFGPWPLAIQIAFFYGLVCFVLDPSLGQSVGRLIGYAWPLIWITFPFMVAKAGIKIASGEAAFLILLYELIAWAPILVGFWNVPGTWVWLLTIPVLYVIVWRCLVRVEAANPPQFYPPKAAATAATLG